MLTPPTSILDSMGPAWRDWIMSNLARGCRPLDMLGRMTGSGWAESHATQALDAAHEQLGMPCAWRTPQPHISSDAWLDINGQQIAVLSRMDTPRALLLDNVLRPEECRELIEQAFRKGLSRSGVVDQASGESITHPARTSTSIHFLRSETELVGRIEQRLARLTHWPVTHGEGLQILRYEIGQQYKAHHDWFNPANTGSDVHLRRGGQRVSTTVIYLACAQTGGATCFPKMGASMNPREGGAVFFHNLKPTGEPDDMSLHAGAPVEKGEKIIATYWQRQSEFV